MNNLNSSNMLLGSGSLYVIPWNNGNELNLNTWETEANRFGHISGGCTISYEPSYYEAKDDLGLVQKTKCTEQNVTLKSGVCTVDADRLSMLTAAGYVNNGIFYIGGLLNAEEKDWLVRFVHQDGSLRASLRATVQSNVELNFQKDNETVIDAEFKAMPMDSNGTLLAIEGI